MVAAPARRRRRGRRIVTLVTLIVIGIGAVAGGGAGLALELTRKATPAEVAAAADRELASRWRRLSAGAIFPATLRYIDASGTQTTASLVGIAPPAGCAAATDPATLVVLRRHGCQVVLRATYTDASGTLAMTEGIAVMASASAASVAESELPGGHYGAGLRAVSFPGTASARFGDPQRAYLGYARGTGPYLFLYAVGYADGRTLPAASRNPDVLAFGAGVTMDVRRALTRGGAPCEMKDIRC